MTLTVADLRTLHPFDAARIRPVMEAVCCYVIFVAGVTLLSLVTGPLTAVIAGGHAGVFVMRLINGIVTGYLAWRIVQARGLKGLQWPALIGVAAVLSAAGYEVIGLGIVAALMCSAKTSF